MNVVTGQFGPSPYRSLAELHEAMRGLIGEWNGRVSLAEVIGLLRMVEHELIEETKG